MIISLLIKEMFWFQFFIQSNVLNTYYVPGDLVVNKTNYVLLLSSL